MTGLLYAPLSTPLANEDGTPTPPWAAFFSSILPGVESTGTVTDVEALIVGTAGVDINSTVVDPTTTPIITLNVPTASATKRGALSSADWSTFNAKQDALVSGVNIKTVNGTSLLGAGDVGTINVAHGGTGGAVASGTLLDNITGFAGTGHLVRTGAGAYSFRTVTGTANEITVTNGSGVAGNPTISLPAAIDLTGKTVSNGIFTNLTSLDVYGATVIHSTLQIGLTTQFGGNIIGDILPNTTNTYNIGSTTQRWLNAYFNSITVYSTATFTGPINLPNSGSIDTSGNLNIVGNTVVTGTVQVGGTTQFGGNIIGDILPNTTNTYSLGSSAKRFLNGHISLLTIYNTVTVPNASGILIQDTDASHTLGVVVGSNLTANRTFTLTTGDVNRTLNISAANVTISAVGATLVNSAAPSNGQIPIGNGTDFTIAALTAGSNVTITPGAGTITIAATGGGTGTVTSVAALTLGITGTDLSSSVATGTTTPVITLNVPTASAANRGALSAADWTTFNAKQAAITPAALTKTDDTNVTLTLGGTPTTALLQATSVTVGWTGTLGVARGGTNIASYAVGDLLYASGATALSKLADVATGNALISGGVTTAPSWGKVGLTTHVSGTLPVANGGTNVTALGDITRTSDTNVTLTLGGAPTGSVVNSVSFTMGWTGTLAVARGGSGAATLTGYLKGNGTSAFTAAATVPASDISSGAALTKVDDTNVTATLGGAPTTALLTAASITLGWTGTLSVARGGTAASTVNGAIASLRNGCMATVTDTSGVNYTAGGFLAFPGTDVYDDASWHDPVTNNTRLTVPSGVTRVCIGFTIEVDNYNINNSFFARVAKNGAYFKGSPSFLGNNTVFTNFVCSAASEGIEVTAGDYFEIFFALYVDTAVDLKAASTSFWIRAC